MSSYYSSDAGRNPSASRSMWSSAAVNSDSGSDNDFTKGKKRKPTDNLLERIQKRLQSENFYDLSSSDEIGKPSPRHSADVSSSFYVRSQSQAYANQDASSMMRPQSGIVVPQAPSPPIISMQEESSAQSLNNAAHAGYAAQQVYKSDPHPQRQLGGNSYDYQSSTATKQEVSTRFGPPSKKPRTEMDLSSTGLSSGLPSLSDFLAEKFGNPPEDDTPHSYRRQQRPATSEKSAMQAMKAEYFTAKKSKFSPLDSDGWGVASSTSSYYARDPSVMAALDQSRRGDPRTNSGQSNERSSGSGTLVQSGVRRGVNDGDSHSPSLGQRSTLESASGSSVGYQQSSQSSQNRPSYQQDFQESSARNKSAFDSDFQGRKFTSAGNNETSSVWAAKESPFQSNRQFMPSSGRFSQSKKLSSGRFGQSEDLSSGRFGQSEKLSSGRFGESEDLSSGRFGQSEDLSSGRFGQSEKLSSGRFGQSEDLSRFDNSSSDLHRNGSGSREGAFSSDFHESSRGSFKTGSRGCDKALASFRNGNEVAKSMPQNSRGGRGGTSSFRSNTGSREELHDSYQSSGVASGSHGSKDNSSMDTRGSYLRGASRNDSQGAFRGGRSDPDVSYLSTSGEHGGPRGSFTGSQGDSNDSYRGGNVHRGGSRGSFTSGRGDSGGSYRGARGGRGTSRGSFTGGRGDAGGSYPGASSTRGGDSRGLLRGGRGDVRGFHAGTSIGRGGEVGSYGGANSGCGNMRGSMRGGRGIPSLEGVTGSSRGTGAPRGGSLSRGAPRGRSTPSRGRSDGKASRFSAAPELQQTGYIIVDSYKSSNSTSEDYSKLPKEALQCSVCKIINFKSSNVFKQHLESQHHAHMLTLLSARNDSLEQFIKSGAKLASRAIEHEVMSNSGRKQSTAKCEESEFIVCSYCDCSVLQSAVSMHNQLIQHRELVEFCRPLCCGIKFTSRQAYEVHKATNKHLTSKHRFERLFIVSAVLTIEKEVLESKKENIHHDFTVKSLTLKQPQYVFKVLQSLERSPLVEIENEDYCLACEVSVPKFRRSFHSNCSDHHANTVCFCSKNKIRLTARITQYLKEVMDSSTVALHKRRASDTAGPGPAATAPKSRASPASATSKPGPKSQARASAAAAPSGPQTRSSPRFAIEKSSPASTENTLSSVEKPPPVPSEEKSKIEKSLLEEEDNDFKDDEFDYEFSGVDIDDMKEEIVKDETDKKSVLKESEDNQDSEEEYVDDEFAYEYDASLGSMNAKSCLETPATASVSPRRPQKTKPEALKDEGDEMEDFEYECVSSAGVNKALNKDNAAETVAEGQEDHKEEEDEEEMDEFDYQFEPAEEPQDHSSKKPETTKAVADDEADGANAASKETKKDSVGDERSSPEADNDDDEEFDYELADGDNESTGVNDNVNGDGLEVNDEFEYDMQVPESGEAQVDAEDDGDGFDYDMPSESPNGTKVPEDINESNTNSDDEISTFDYEIPEEESHVEEDMKEDPPAPAIKDTEHTSGATDEKSACEDTAGVAATEANKEDERSEELDGKVVQTQENSIDPASEAEEDEFDYQYPAATMTVGDKIESEAKSSTEEASSISSGRGEVEEEKSDTIPGTEKPEDEEVGIATTPSSKRKRPRKISGSDKSTEESVPKATAQAVTRPKRRSIAPIRFK